MLKIGGTFLNDKYTIEEKLGQGSLGMVYKARENISGSISAIKEIIDDDYINILMKEIKLMATLDHPHVVRYKTSEKNEGNLYLVMEYMPGGSLVSVMNEISPLAPDRAVNVLIHILEGLSYLHSQNIVHRDLKPDNILFDSDGNAKISDFGVSRILSRSRKAASNVGTVLYMAPEMFKVDDEEGYDHRVDLYSTGILFYEMLTGKTPFTGSQASIMKGHLKVIPHYPEGLPEKMIQILNDLLEKDREKRFQTADAVIAELKKADSPSAGKGNARESDSMRQEPSQNRNTLVAPGLKQKQLSLEAIPAKRKFEKTNDYEERITNMPSLEAGVVKLISYEPDEELFEIEVLSTKAEIEGMPSVMDKIVIKIPPEQAEKLETSSLNSEIRFFVTLAAANASPFIKESFIRFEQNNYFFSINPVLTGLLKTIKCPLTGMEFVFIKGGVYYMGDIFNEGDDNEKPVHKVQLDDFYLGKYPVTQAEWKIVMKSNPSQCKKGDRYPVEGVSWDDAKTFVGHLGSQYRLPTEAEWEYAARERGRKVRFGNGKDIADPIEMNFNGNFETETSNPGLYRKSPTYVSYFEPNALGIHDMSGNVWEWCQDIYRDDAYNHHTYSNPVYDKYGDNGVIRGGSWRSRAHDLRCTRRHNDPPKGRLNNVGLRLVKHV